MNSVFTRMLYEMSISNSKHTCLWTIFHGVCFSALGKRIILEKWVPLCVAKCPWFWKKKDKNLEVYCFLQISKFLLLFQKVLVSKTKLKIYRLKVKLKNKQTRFDKMSAIHVRVYVYMLLGHQFRTIVKEILVGFQTP